MRRLRLLAFPLALAACEQIPSEGPTAPSGGSPGLALAKSSCGSCHGIESFALSPNPKAPPFAAIANQEGLTAGTLSTWLRDAHNYPAEMNFTLRPEQIEAIAAYMVTLRDPNYRPPG